MVALKIYYNHMVQARKETHDHVSVRVKCLNYTCPNEFSVVGINKAILISSMTLRGETPPKSSSIGGRKISPQKLFKTIADRLQVSQGKWVGSAKGILPMLIICVDIPKLLGLGSALLQNYPLTKGKYYVSSRNNNKEESRYGTRI